MLQSAHDSRHSLAVSNVDDARMQFVQCECGMPWPPSVMYIILDYSVERDDTMAAVHDMMYVC